VTRNEIKDSGGRPLAQDIKIACLATTVPPAVDIEASNDNSSVGELEKRRIKERREALEARSTPGSDRLLVLGSANGSVVFLDVKQLETVYARFFFHRAAITHMIELPKRGRFISTCEEFYVCVWGFNEDGLSAQKLSFVPMFRPVTQLVPMGDNIIMSFGSSEKGEEKGADLEDSGTMMDLYLFRYDDAIGDLLHLRTEQSSAHDGTIS
jgi:hypothetical protein